MGVPRLEGYVIELHRLMRHLRYPRFPIYRVRQCGSVWEARVEVHTRVPSESDYRFPTRHRHDLPETAMQDAAREAFLRLSSIHRAELVSTEFAHHLFREESNSVCTVQDTPCCYNPIVTLLSRWAEAVDDFYEEALLEIDDQQRHMGELETEVTDLTVQQLQLEEEHQAWGSEIDSLKAQLQVHGDQFQQLSDQYNDSRGMMDTLEEQLREIGRDRYFFLTLPYPPALHALLGEVGMLATESAPYLVDPTVTQPPAPEIVHTPLIPTPSPQLGSSLETPIQVDSETEGTDTEPEIEPDITNPSEDETPVPRITFLGGPRTLSTARKSTRPPSKKPKPDPEATTSEPWGLRVMATETQLLQAIANNQGNRGGSSFGEFMRTKPPTFATVDEPMEAEDWLRIIENKLTLVRGPAGDWWDTYKEAREEDDGEPTWEEFTAAFRENFVPTAVMRMKRNEFRRLRQGNTTVQEYLNRFTQLARYAIGDLADEEEKIDKFIEGLNDELRGPMIGQDQESFQSLINKVVRLENDQRTVEHNRKRRLSMNRLPQGVPQRLKEATSSGWKTPIVATNRPAAPSKFNRSVAIQNRTPTPTLAAPGAKKNVDCLNCGEYGHYANNCPHPHKTPVRTGANAMIVRGTTTPTTGRGLFKTPQTNRTATGFGRGQVNHVRAEEAQEDQGVLMGMFSVNSTPVKVLFDSGASHSFISLKASQKHNLTLVGLRKPMIVHSPGGEITGCGVSLQPYGFDTPDPGCCHAQKFPNRIPSRMCIKIPVQDQPGYTNDNVDIQIHVLQTS
uniref:Retrotransposon protein, putative, Ty3-gypsy subclass n=2 Tax=Oryza sativa subsp. japonica TaxID=39947 RepID=Q53MS0_ORYSJ|nr:retrotransposon protein, putative, Ty3-gypsy sub-class [Oryza sativa Japonica Group]ABA92831.1 retrotransposon protein, putative, Ty3-gypsy subclass [Oryza sativa Japonica Group]